MQQIKLADHFTYKKLLRFTFPCIIMMIVTSIYSIVDGFFVSNFVGKNAFAAVNLVMPVLMGLSAVGFMIGTGGSALIAKTLGEGRREKANEIFTMLIAFLVVVGAVFTILGFAFMPQIVRFLGASDAIYQDCLLYGRILILVDIFFMMQNSYQSFAVAAEKPHMGLTITIISGVMNIVLDVLFVYVFPFGVAGAAAATAISQVAGAVIPTIYFMRKNDSLLQFGKLKADWKALRRACANGSSEMLSNLSMSLVGILYNFQLMKFAAEDGIAAYGVIMYVNFVFMAFFIGYNIGTGPVVGYHYGAQNHRELKSLLRKSLVITLAAAVIMTVIAEVSALPLSKIFVGYDETLCQMTVIGFRLYSLSFLVCGFNIFGSAFFTGLNNGIVSAIISFLRTLVVEVIAILVLPVFWGLNGVWLAIVAAEGATLIITAYFLLKNRKKYQY